MVLTAAAAYEELIRRTREVAVIHSAAELLGWDELTQMPAGGVEHRGNQLAVLAGICHERATDPRLGELLDVLEGLPATGDPESPVPSNVRELRRRYRRLTRLPRSLIEELARITSTAQQVWEVAKAEEDFPRLRPWLERIVALKRNEAECLSQGGSLYDALLDDYEPGLSQETVQQVFAALRSDLQDLLAQILACDQRAPTAILRRDFPIDRQRIFIETLAGAAGFDFQRGRLDTTTHPFFSSIGPDDCRITTRFDPHQVSEAIFATLHEVGHGLYEQGLDPAHYGTPWGESAWLSIHESQARLWENLVGRTRPFWAHFFPVACQVFPDALHGVTLDEFYRAINHVEPGSNRVRADQVTYDLHIMIRFELEQSLISGDLPLTDLPAAWNRLYEQYLGVRPPSDAEGCLQDSHWASGMFGYFPGYTLGNIYAAQIFAAAEAELGDLQPRFAVGQFGELLEWLGHNIYRHGQRYPTAELIRRVTGGPLDHGPCMSALRTRYAELCGF